MNNIFTKFEQEIEEHFKKFLPHLSSKFKLTNSEVFLEWERFNGKISTPSQTVTEKQSRDESTTCNYLFIKGKNEGTKCANPTKDEKKFCSKHAKFEETDQKEKKVVPKLEVKKVKFILMRLKGTTYWWHQDSRFVFVSPEKKTVIAKYINGNLQKLTPEDIDECKKYKFVCDPSFEFNSIPEEKTETPKKVVLEKLVKKPTIPSPPKLPQEKKETPKEIPKAIPKMKETMKEQISKTNVKAKNIEDIIGGMFKGDDSEEDDDDLDISDDDDESDNDDESEDEDDVLGASDDDDDSDVDNDDDSDEDDDDILDDDE
jgi:hypothetical protein